MQSAKTATAAPPEAAPLSLRHKFWRDFADAGFRIPRCVGRKFPWRFDRRCRTASPPPFERYSGHFQRPPTARAKPRRRAAVASSAPHAT